MVYATGATSFHSLWGHRRISLVHTTRLLHIVQGKRITSFKEKNEQWCSSGVLAMPRLAVV